MTRTNTKKFTPAARMVFLALILALFRPALSSAQTETSSLAARVTAVLEKFPADSGSGMEAAAASLLSLGEPGILEACRRLAPAGAEDDSLVRFALHGAAVYGARPGAEADRALVAGSLLKALDAARDSGPKAFLISQIQLVGRDECVPAIGAFLADPELADPAARALTTLGGPRAEAALIGALTKTPGAAPRPVIQALGQMKSRNSVPALLGLSSGQDPALRNSALAALAEIGDPAARSALVMIPLTLTAAERAAAAERLLRFADRLIENGDRAEGIAIERRILAGFTLPGESQVRSAALDRLGREAGESLSDDLLEAAGSGDRMFRQKALALAEARKEPAAAVWLHKAPSLPAENQADLIAMLGRRGDQEAQVFIREKLAAGDPVLRRAAIRALAGLEGPRAADDLLPLLNSADPDQVRDVQDAIRGWPSELAVPKLAAVYASLPAPARLAALEIFAERRARAAMPLLLDAAADRDENLRAAALAALEAATGPEDVPGLLKLFSNPRTNKETMALQSAVAAAAKRNPDAEKRADAVLAAVKKSKGAKRADLLRPLARIGGSKALAAVVADLRNKDAAVQASAAYVLASWPDASALDSLFQMGRTAADKKTRYLSLQGISRLLGSAYARADRLARWSQAFEMAVQPDEKALLIAGLGNIHEMEAVRAAEALLSQPAYQIKAADAILRQVLPSPGFAGLAGPDAAKSLREALPYIESEYDRGEAEKYAAGLLLKEGFVQAFNGKDLNGWKGLVADPPARAKMGPAELAKAQAEADDLMRAHWRVVDGVLVFDGGGHSLCTVKVYGDFEMFVDWKIEPKGDSGIYLRGSPQVQVWDPAQWPEGSGGLYNNQKNPSKPSVKADRPIGEWNSFYIKMTGERVTVVLNGVLVVDGVVMENYWERDKPIYPTGQIELQAHSTTLNYKNIFIREIPGAGAPQTAAAGLTEEERAGGFVSLFDGSDLLGWTGDTKGYVVQDGTIAALPEGTGNLYTEKEYSDFDLRFEFRLTPGANNGIGIRAPLSGDAAYVGMEIQVLDDSADVYKNLQPYQYHGSIYGVVPTRRGFQKPVGEWNAEEIVARGRRITVKLNGTVIVDADIDAASASGTVDHREHPGLKNASGHIGFLGHGSRVEFRNLRIQELR